MSPGYNRSSLCQSRSVTLFPRHHSGSIIPNQLIVRHIVSQLLGSVLIPYMFPGDYHRYRRWSVGERGCAGMAMGEMWPDPLLGDAVGRVAQFPRLELYSVRVEKDFLYCTATATASFKRGFCRSTLHAPRNHTSLHHYCLLCATPSEHLGFLDWCAQSRQAVPFLLKLPVVRPVDVR